MKLKVGDYFLWDDTGWFTIGKILKIDYTNDGRKYFQYKDIVNRLHDKDMTKTITKFYEHSSFHITLKIISKEEIYMELI